jgi:hypothetical protein
MRQICDICGLHNYYVLLEFHRFDLVLLCARVMSMVSFFPPKFSWAILKSMSVGGNLQPGSRMHPPNPSLGRVWGRARNA